MFHPQALYKLVSKSAFAQIISLKLNMLHAHNVGQDHQKFVDEVTSQCSLYWFVGWANTAKLYAQLWWSCTKYINFGLEWTRAPVSPNFENSIEPVCKHTEPKSRHYLRGGTRFTRLGPEPSEVGTSWERDFECPQDWWEDTWFCSGNFQCQNY